MGGRLLKWFRNVPDPGAAKAQTSNVPAPLYRVVMLTIEVYPLLDGMGGVGIKVPLPNNEGRQLLTLTGPQAVWVARNILEASTESGG